MNSLKIELQILLGLNCNFKCSHCLNSSKPGLRDFDISETEIKSLLQEVIDSENVKYVTFSGGEPLLYIDKIKHIVLTLRNKRPELKFSLTTNGALIEKNSKTLELLKIEYCMLSFDQEHAEYISPTSFVKVLVNAKKLFNKIEINVTHGFNLYIHDDIKNYVLAENIKLNLNHKVQSGRNKETVDYIDSTFNHISCPNINEKKMKISFVPTKGFTICCGPIIFDKITEDSMAYVSSLSLVSESLLYNFLKKTSIVPLYNNGMTDCDKCKNCLFKMNNAEISYFISNKSWSDDLNNYTYDDLSRMNKLFYPKYVKIVQPGTFKNPYNSFLYKQKKLVSKEIGDGLMSLEIEEFSDFTIDTFYKVHTNFYSLSDIRRFKKDQAIFFNLPNKYIRHKIDGKVVAYLVVCFIDNHPFFKRPAWHIGYWGILSGTDRDLREKIKQEWGDFLSVLNSKVAIVANIDYFNKPADKMSSCFNFETVCVKFDPRT